MEGGIVAKRLPLSERFWSKVSKGGSDECWMWAASCGTNGYGQFSMPGDRIVKSHRIAWILTHGEIEDGMCVLHKCDNPPCCNPSHLFLGTVADNNRDMRQKGRDVSAKLIQRARRLEPWWVEYERRNTPKWKRARLDASRGGMA